MSALKVLLIDNFDSFTFNLYQDLGGLLEKRRDGSTITVIRNNEWTLDQVRAFAPDRIVVSPGPGNPTDPAYFGICAEVIRELGPQIPLLGVCLGMQGICAVFGATITHARVPMHGKQSPVRHDNVGVYAGLPQDVEVMRYHSLVADPKTLPDCLIVNSVIAPTAKELQDLGDSSPSLSDLKALSAIGFEVMGVRHKDYPIQGIQFHPESFGTEGGSLMLKNFLDQA
jgi:anthranilate synthase/aminodeoxychorismate synthase-like glutamine amidotransferase